MTVIDLFENGKLKSQKLNLASLLSKPEQYLAPIRALDVDEQCTSLQRVIDYLSQKVPKCKAFVWLLYA